MATSTPIYRQIGLREGFLGQCRWASNSLRETSGNEGNSLEGRGVQGEAEVLRRLYLDGLAAFRGSGIFKNVFSYSLWGKVHEWPGHF